MCLLVYNKAIDPKKKKPSMGEVGSPSSVGERSSEQVSMALSMDGLMGTPAFRKVESRVVGKVSCVGLVTVVAKSNTNGECALLSVACSAAYALKNPGFRGRLLDAVGPVAAERVVAMEARWLRKVFVKYVGNMILHGGDQLAWIDIAANQVFGEDGDVASKREKLVVWLGKEHQALPDEAIPLLAACLECEIVVVQHKTIRGFFSCAQERFIVNDGVKEDADYDVVVSVYGPVLEEEVRVSEMLGDPNLFRHAVVLLHDQKSEHYATFMTMGWGNVCQRDVFTPEYYMGMPGATHVIEDAPYFTVGPHGRVVKPGKKQRKSWRKGRGRFFQKAEPEREQRPAKEKVPEMPKQGAEPKQVVLESKQEAAAVGKAVEAKEVVAAQEKMKVVMQPSAAQTQLEAMKRLATPVRSGATSPKGGALFSAVISGSPVCTPVRVIVGEGGNVRTGKRGLSTSPESTMASLAAQPPMKKMSGPAKLEKEPAAKEEKVQVQESNVSKQPEPPVRKPKGRWYPESEWRAMKKATWDRQAKERFGAKWLAPGPPPRPQQQREVSNRPVLQGLLITVGAKGRSVQSAAVKEPQRPTPGLKEMVYMCGNGNCKQGFVSAPEREFHFKAANHGPNRGGSGLMGGAEGDASSLPPAPAVSAPVAQAVPAAQAASQAVEQEQSQQNEAPQRMDGVDQQEATRA